MCGIVGIFNISEPIPQAREKALRMATKIRHRGPDWSGIYSDDKAVLAHERLSIVDVETGAQPLFDKKNGNTLAVNGEIYNHLALHKDLKQEHLWQTKSDCEVILYLYDEYGPDFLNMLNGMFAFVLYDKQKGTYFIARDHIGIIPLYIGSDDKGTLYVASEMKALNEFCTTVKEFPPGHYMNGNQELVQWYKPEWAQKIPTKKLDYIGTVHHEIIFTIQEGFDAIKDVIYHLETFDVTTIRAATPMYLMARKIKSMGIKMVLSGEGADEVFGGYLYFHKAPNKQEFYEETVRKLSMLSKYDCLRANKATAAWGVETRVPFLDREFLDFAMNFDPEEKMCSGDKIEKYVLRKAFEGYIPEEILWRQKEQFSDGVGYGWIDYLKKHAESSVSDEMMANAKTRFPVQTPQSKEEYYYRQIFDSYFSCPAAALTVPVGPTIACSTPTAFRWSKEFAKNADPSGRSVKDHKAANDKT